MTQTALSFTRPSPGELGFKEGSQKERLYSRLLEGDTDNGEMLFKLRIGNHTARLSEIREALRPYLYDIKAVPDQVDRSRVVYRVV